MEMMPACSFESVMSMPYSFFGETLKWKWELEEAKKKQLEDKSRPKSK